ncbi:unnamed protein product, partial [Heterosigma akashiwo]
MMIFTPLCTFLGDSWNAWIMHFFLVILADVITVGSQVNPAVSVAIYLHDWIPFNGLCARLIGQGLAACIVFPMLGVFSPSHVPFSGPEIAEGLAIREAITTEFLVTMGLMLVILACTDFIKPPAHRPFVGIGIRALVVAGQHRTGPGMNPMIALGWAW